MVGDRAAILFAVDGDSGHLVNGGLGVATDGTQAFIGGIQLRPAIGSYPSLVVSAVPAPPALLLGGVALLIGLGWAFAWPDRATKAPSERTAAASRAT
jgi:hypothetical protein